MPIFINPSKMEASDWIAEPPPPDAISTKESSTGALIRPQEVQGLFKGSYKYSRVHRQNLGEFPFRRGFSSKQFKSQNPNQEIQSPISKTPFKKNNSSNIFFSSSNSTTGSS
ncbi:hypothetical protein NE237_004412 [Protea cynaroides]|uniref:Uncharacterized protein n=1 Tax=Protea cynaroides TaxID=273540 RepID=A0A9Q0KIM1_9MAGN|nr:hypothetical protein NE237_004412 [Protea cynaroides]